jgi:hypothetical protein
VIWLSVFRVCSRGSIVLGLVVGGDSGTLAKTVEVTK